MGNYSLRLDPTDENIYQSLKNNTLRNNNWINKCLSVLLKMDNSIIAFDASWGNGKTFLAKQFQIVINEKWEIETGIKSNSEFSKINDLNFDEIEQNSYYAIYYNAWEYDNDNDPIASFLYYLLKILNKKIQSNTFSNIASSFVKNVIEKISYGWIKINEEGQGNNIEKVLSSVVETESIREEIKKLLDELRTEKFNNLIIFVDELDRCRPTYALKIIEMIKHYLKMENILIVCMTDIRQLSNSIKSIYGSDYNYSDYLNKIFDYKFTIPTFKYDKKAYIEMKVNTVFQETFYLDCVCLEVVNYFNLSLRDVDKSLEYFRAMLDFTKKETNTDFNIKAFVNYLFFPYYVAVASFKQVLYEKLLNNDCSDYLTFCRRGNINYRIKKIYQEIMSDEYDENKLFEYLKNDCELMLKELNEEKIKSEKYYVNRNNAYYTVNTYLKNIDMVNFLLDNTK